MLLLCHFSKDDPNFDEWKLKELMWQCELKCFLETGETITGCAYFKEPDPPRPAPGGEQP